MTWKRHLNQTFNHYYLFNSRLLTHITFWLAYYLSFAFIWATKNGLYASFYLEFILLPLRIAATYSVLYWLMPQYLLTRKIIKFFLYLILMLVIFGSLQRLIIFAFYEELLIKSGTKLFDIKSILKSSLLINTTVMLAMTIKWYGIYQSMAAQSNLSIKKIKIKSDRRTHLVNPDSIMHIEGLGNYIKIFLNNGESLTTYSSIKKIIGQLPNHFIRCHRSHVINTQYIDSFNNENIFIRQVTIPRGKEVSDSELICHHGGMN